MDRRKLCGPLDLRVALTSALWWEEWLPLPGGLAVQGTTILGGLSAPLQPSFPSVSACHLVPPTPRLQSDKVRTWPLTSKAQSWAQQVTQRAEYTGPPCPRLSHPSCG